MAEAHDQNSIEALRAEINKLSSQFENIVKSVEKRKDDVATDLTDKLSEEIDRLRLFARDHAHKAYDAGQAGIDEVGEHVRRNPVASLLIAFGAGCVISCLFRHLR